MLVGYRLHSSTIDTENSKTITETRYLFQNWWNDMPYVEVDIDYLVSCRATLHFILEKQTEIGAYTTNSGTMVECAAGIDAPEIFMPET